MTSLTDPPKESFRLSMLIYDTRYRSMTIQIVALIGFLILVGWLISNTAQNLVDLGKEPSFGFLSEPAGYDINQRLIEYNSQSSHFRAAIVGLLNTLLVAALGCATATVIGVVIGVLRLSKNWLVARIMTVYVEMFRNVPLLLWIVFIMAIVIETLPQPRDFRGENPAASMLLGDSVALTGRGFYIPAIEFTNSVTATGAEEVDAVVGGSLDWLIVFAVLAISIFAIRRVRRRADRIQEATGLRPTTWYLQLGLLIVPVGIVFILLGAQLEYPALRGFNFAGGIYMRNSLIALWLALSLYTSAFVAEIVRSGIMAVSGGQTEAAAALGLRPRRVMNLVVLPQALRVIIPPLISQYLNLTKNSSLAIAVGYMDLTGTLMGITLNQTGRELETVMLGMLIYLMISLMISAVMNWYNNRVKLVER
ncbi:L-glutamine ABC transporter membrane protein /L-glutamate ABC transporter membrane protein /L-aspartate ABC transporter membrane protein /L-asparagine ABC transporter membrane protein [Salinihabitans flavidus]|uniref:L-glutamine ABC transporter membrane protein /L-glutamate ABC transporter membrane protein /L-aspartate ABC transporter membrane protein /L-asparagine ABC transporter membrane protein n=1 Tax=Salinihabitans flavidus TaxID=569882 RepID=A0A1H8VJC8_9RHOB|nr:ABC transporter permease subunit [Salinihabitans flavidus]SEP15481.1 L-glutamine ABC transporter membrane protein /L-glutamate ABC transporter membrane protein /L-aspartate ABC transporter membrane protein /L-asparagine ABC transporter membrane protein [Salinihabitans flavidus]